MSDEIWKDAVGFEGSYQVSSWGRVRRIGRGRGISSGRVLKASAGNAGYPTVGLYMNGKQLQRTVHRLVASAFLPNPNNHPLVRHKDDVKTNNFLNNLAWGTHSENVQDMLTNGLHGQVSKTHCPLGHEYSKENTYFIRGGKGRACRACRKIKQSEFRERIRATDPSTWPHGTEYGYNAYGCKCSECLAATAAAAMKRKKARNDGSRNLEEN